MTPRKTSSTIPKSQYDDVGAESPSSEGNNESTSFQAASTYGDDEAEDGIDEDEMSVTGDGAPDVAIPGTTSDTVRSTKRPLEKKRNKRDKLIKEDHLMGKAIHLLNSRTDKRKKKDDPQDVFGQHVAHQLRDLENDGIREYAKLQNQQI